ncbi:MAG: type II CRISPR RNA-guided endonuclease Cas9, partial [Deltaproteobacteria bacterium]
MSSQPRRQGWILGLDLGIASVGWACLEHDGQGKPTGILAAGTHVFEAAVENGQAADQTPAAKRRAVRSQRRLLWRRRQRRRKTARLLQQAGLLPAGPMDTSEELGKLIKGLDADLAKRWSSRVPPSQRDRLVYHIRAAAAQGPVEPDELGRAIYHLAQRRGFKSNRRADRKADDKETGKVKEGINELRRLMHEAGARTLGAYFATVDPHERRIRNRYTHRAMYEEEFEAIWSAQQPHHAVLTPELHDALHDALFFQRPIRKQPGLVGMCSLVQGKRRAPKALRAYQRFRMLQGVNHLRIDEPGRSARPLTAEERKKVIEALEREGDLTFAKLRQKKLLALPKEVEFDLAQAQFDRGEDKKGDRKIIGHRTDAKLRKVLGDCFDALTEEEKDQLVHELRSIPTEEGLIRRATRHWHFTMEQAEQLADLQLEDGYAALSLTAINRLLPHLEQGLSYAEARKREFPESFKSEDALDALPPVDKAIDNLNNPSVRRAMRELRMVVNALIREHGKPGRIHIELAR